MSETLIDLVEKVEDLKAAYALQSQFANINDPEGQTLARESVLNAQGLEVSTSDEQLRTLLTKDVSVSRDDALAYFIGNSEEILEEIPDKILRERALEYLPSKGIIPNPEGGEQAQRHLNYLGLTKLVKKYSSDQASDQEVSRLTRLAVDAKTKEVIEEHKKNNPNVSDRSLLLVASTARTLILSSRDPTEEIRKYGEKAVEYAKDDFEKGFSDEYTQTDYARDLLRYAGERDPEKTAMAISEMISS